jgi:Zn-dependent protease
MPTTTHSVADRTPIGQRALDLFDNLFIQQAFDPSTRFYYISIVLSAVISITLHELAHGWAAIRFGDLTPIRTGHMTGNPLIHMGPFSIGVLLVMGFAWGQMPIDPTRLRGRYAEAWVAFAGPAVNFMLSLAALTSLGLWIRFGTMTGSSLEVNGLHFLNAFGSINAILFVFNLFPIPPLDGSHILANFNRKYAQFIGDPAHQGLMLMAFIFMFSLARVIFDPVLRATGAYTSWIVNVQF